MCGSTVVTAQRDEVAKAKKTGEWSRAEKLSREKGAASALMFPPKGFSEFAKYNIGLEKARADAGGCMKAGPCRPPYHLAPEPYLKGARRSGKRWAEIDAALISGKYFE